MSRSENKQQEDQSVGGFVPASYQGSHHSNKSRKGSASSHDMADSVSQPYVNASPAAQYSRNNANYSSAASSGSKRGSKIAIVIIIVVLVAAATALGVFIYKEMQKNSINEQLHSDVTQEELEAIDNELTATMTFDEPFTVLLLGSDARVDDPEMGARTDSIILVRIDPMQNIISMVSIPRDTKIEIPGYGTNKFNAAYTFGGPSGTIAAVKELCNVDINHYAEVNFEGLVGLVDAIGGVDVFVDETIDDPDAGDIVIPAGEQHLDGAAALVFSRSRAYVDGDFTRVSNQRKVIEAIVHKGLEAPATELYGLIQASAAFLTTDSAMDVDFIYSLADQIRHNNDYPVTLYTATIPASTATIDGISYVLADNAGVAEMMDVFLAGGDVSFGAAEEAAAEAVPTEVEASEVTEVPASPELGYYEEGGDEGYDYGYDYDYGEDEEDYTGSYDYGYDEDEDEYE